MALLSPWWRKASKWVHFQVNPSGCSDLSKSFGYHIKMPEITSYFSTLWTQPWVFDPVFGSRWREPAITAELSSSSGVHYPSRSVLVSGISQSHIKEMPDGECLLKNKCNSYVCGFYSSLFTGKTTGCEERWRPPTLFWESCIHPYKNKMQTPLSSLKFLASVTAATCRIYSRSYWEMAALLAIQLSLPSYLGKISRFQEILGGREHQFTFIWTSVWLQE